MPQVRSCGGCTICCKLVGVEEIDKKAGTWCPHCSRTGCSKFGDPTRPASCGEFVCLWAAGLWPERMKPSQTKVVPWLNTKGDTVVLFEDYAGASVNVSDHIDRIVKDGGSVIIVCGNKRKIITSSARE